MNKLFDFDFENFVRVSYLTYVNTDNYHEYNNVPIIITFCRSCSCFTISVGLLNVLFGRPHLIYVMSYGQHSIMFKITHGMYVFSNYFQNIR